jgi:hypothetical protein
MTLGVLTRRFRRIIAGSQIAGGAMLLCIIPLLLARGARWEPWYLALLLGLGVGSMTAGVWLWRGDPRGVLWSRPIQAIQIVQLRTSTWGFGVALGLHARFVIGNGQITTAAGFESTVNLLVGREMGGMLIINFFSLFALIALLRGPEPRDEPADPDPFDDEPPAVRAEPGPATETDDAVPAAPADAGTSATASSESREP